MHWYTATLSKLQQNFSHFHELKTDFRQYDDVRQYDADGDDHVSRNELRHVMAQSSETEVDSIFALGDKD